MSKLNDIYRDNPLLKRAFVPIEWESWQVEEYIKCSKDIDYFINKYVKIINLDHGLVPFKTYPYQTDMAETIKDNRFVIIKTCRQAGKCVKESTIINIRNKKTGKTEKITVGELHARAQAQTK